MSELFVKHPALPPCMADGHYKNLLYYYLLEGVATTFSWVWGVGSIPVSVSRRLPWPCGSSPSASAAPAPPADARTCACVP